MAARARAGATRERKDAAYAIRASSVQTHDTCHGCTDAPAPSRQTERMKSDYFEDDVDAGRQILFSPINLSPELSPGNNDSNSITDRQFSNLHEQNPLGMAAATCIFSCASDDEDTATITSTATFDSNNFSMRDHRSPSTISASRCVKVHASAERLGQNIPSADVLKFGKGKGALTFPDSDNDNGFVFGSREGEYCLLRIQIKSVRDDDIVPVTKVVNAQMLYQKSGVLNLKFVETQNASDCKELVVLLDPAVLQRPARLVSNGQDEAVRMPDLRFQLHIRVKLMDSRYRKSVIVKTFCWRTVPQTEWKMSSRLKRLRLHTWNLISGMFPKEGTVDEINCHSMFVKQRWALKKDRVRRILPVVSWDHVF